MQRHVLSKSIEDAVGERSVLGLLFCTHDLDPDFFEQEVLQAFLGNDLKHNRRTREVQLDLVIRERELPIDVFYEPRALVAAEGTARLGWHRHAMRVTTGLFHPKVVLVMCADREGRESLVVCVSSANLTQSSWWRNIECAEVVRIDDGHRHGYVGGLRDLLEKLSRRKRSQGGAPALQLVRSFLSRQTGYSNTTVNGRLVPRLLGGFDPLLDTVWALGGGRLQDAHLEIIAPFFDGTPTQVVAMLEEWKDTFQPRSLKVALPGRDGRTTLSEEIYDAVDQMPGVTWAKLPRAYVKGSDSEDARDRSLHAKVYRLWRAKPDPLEVIVVGSHNLTRAAHSGKNNWEVSVVFEPEGPHLMRLLEDETDRPCDFLLYDDDLGDEPAQDAVDLPLLLTYDWAEPGSATATWLGRSPETITVVRSGRRLFDLDLPSKATVGLDDASAGELADALKLSALLTCRRRDGKEGVILCEELNHDLKPDLLESLQLTPAEIFALWSVDGLDERLRRLAGVNARVDVDEDDLELVEDVPRVRPSMFERYAGVFHAFASLRKRVDAAMAEGNIRRAGRTVYSEHFDSPFNALRVMREDDDTDPALAYVTWSCARQLDESVATAHPSLTSEFAGARSRLTTMLQHQTSVRAALLESGSGDPEMSRFLKWFDVEFAKDPRDG